MATVWLLSTFLLLFTLCERLLRCWELIQVEIIDLNVVERDNVRCTHAAANSNNAQPLHLFEINIVCSAAVTAFVKVTALIRYDFNLVDPVTSTSFHVSNVLVIFELEAMAFDTIR